MDNQLDLLRRQVQVGLAVAEAMNTARDRETILSVMLAALVNELGYRAASLRMLDAESGRLELAAAHGLSDEYVKKGGVELAHGELDRRVLAGETAALADVTRDPDIESREAATREGVRSVLAVPLRMGGRTVGALRVYTAEVRDFTTEEQAFLAGMANLAARAIANARLYQAFRKIAREVNSSLDVQQVLRNLLHSLLAELNFKAAAVRLLGPQGKRLHLAAAEGLSDSYLAKGEVRVADSPIDRRVMAENGPVNLYDTSGEAGFQYPQEAAREGIRSVLAVPLRVGQQIVGVLRVYSGQPHRFTGEEIALVEAVADLGAVALDHARLHETLQEKYEAAREDWAGWFRYLAFS